MIDRYANDYVEDFLTEEERQMSVEALREKYPRLREWPDEVVEEARRNECLMTPRGGLDDDFTTDTEIAASLGKKEDTAC